MDKIGTKVRVSAGQKLENLEQFLIINQNPDTSETNDKVLKKSKRMARFIDESAPLEDILEELEEEFGEDFYSRFIYNNADTIEDSPDCDLSLYCEKSISESFIEIKWRSKEISLSFCRSCIADYVMEEKSLRDIVTKP